MTNKYLEKIAEKDHSRFTRREAIDTLKNYDSDVQRIKERGKKRAKDNAATVGSLAAAGGILGSTPAALKGKIPKKGPLLGAALAGGAVAPMMIKDYLKGKKQDKTDLDALKRYKQMSIDALEKKKKK